MEVSPASFVAPPLRVCLPGRLLRPVTLHESTPDVGSVAMHRTRFFPGSRFALNVPAFMPVNVGLVGGEASRLIVTGTVVVPPALSAAHEKVFALSVVTDTGPQPVARPIGEPSSNTLQLRLTLPWYQPFAPSGVG